MDVAGLAIGIVGLYTACRDCYDFFTTVNAAQAESSAHLRELEIQQSILKAWGFHWQIQNEDGSDPGHSDHARRKRSKLHQYLLSNRFKAEGVFKTLSALADTLCNREKLIKRYGFQLQTAQAIQDGSQSTHDIQLVIPDAKIEDVEPVLNEVRNRLSMLNKLKWALKDKEKFKKLIADLRSHSENLYRLCPENAFESMNIYLTMECLAGQESPDGLKWTSTLATENAELDKESLVRQGYELLASTATLKASVTKNRDKKEANGRSLTSIDEIKPEMRYLGKGLALFEDQVVYVEMRDYRGPPLDFTAEQKQRLKQRRKRERYLSSLQSYRRHDASQMGQFSSSEDDEPIERVRPADSKLRALIRNCFDTFQGANMMKNVYGLDIVGMIDHTEGDDKGHCSILYRLTGTIGAQSRERPAENLKLRAPVTLQSLLGTREQTGIRSMLGARFELARKLPILMGYIFSRPHHITTTKGDPTSATGPETESLDYGKRRWRPSSHFTATWDSPCEESKSIRRRSTPSTATIYGRDMLGKVASAEEAKETSISGFTLDYYQHPAKHADPERLYRHAYDVYSLRVLLLEVGLWINLKNDSDMDRDEEDHYQRRRKICRRYLDRLRWECGDTYADVVLSCLMIDSTDDEVAKASERKLCGRIVADLENCQA
ncbi:hypothetical protein FVER53590_03333 [Fusarium verticillioides]|nr:hypothetical protein FVER53590_03333 [Fusarium verticillioides]